MNARMSGSVAFENVRKKERNHFIEKRRTHSIEKYVINKTCSVSIVAAAAAPPSAPAHRHTQSAEINGMAGDFGDLLQHEKYVYRSR